MAWGDPESTLAETMAGIGDGAELVTVIGGRDAPIPLAQMEQHVPDGVELETHDGGQPAYWWLIAAE